MKTAVSVPDPVFEAAERAKRRLRLSRSELYAKALAAYVREHGGEDVTDALNRVYADVPSDLDPVLALLQTASVSQAKW